MIEIQKCVDEEWISTISTASHYFKDRKEEDSFLGRDDSKKTFNSFICF